MLDSNSTWTGHLIKVSLPIICAALGFYIGQRDLLKKQNDAPIIFDLDESSKKKKKKDKKKVSQLPSPVVQPIVSQQEEEKMVESSESSDTEQDLLNLAVIQGKSVSVNKAAVKAPVTSSSEDGAEWNRVPTKSEEQVNALKSKIQHLTTQLEQAKDDLEGSRAMEGQFINKFNALDRQFKDQMRSWQLRNLSLEGEINGLRLINANLKKNLDDAENSRKHELTEIAEQLISERQQLEDALSQAQVERSLLQQQLSHEIEGAAALRLEVERQAAVIKALEQSKAKDTALEVELSSAKEEIVNLESQLSTSNSQLSEAQSIIKQLTADLESSRSAVAEKTQMLKEFEAECLRIPELLNEKAHLAASIDSLKSEKEQQISELTEMCQQLKEKIPSLEETVEKKTLENESLTAQVLELKSNEALEKLQRDYESVKKKFAETLRLNIDLKAQLEQQQN